MLIPFILLTAFWISSSDIPEEPITELDLETREILEIK